MTSSSCAISASPILTSPSTARQAARFGINVADIQDAVQTAVGGNAVSQVLMGEQRYDVVVRYQEPYRKTQDAIARVRLLSPSGERVSLAQLATVEVKDGAYDIYREGNSRYVAITFNVRGRDLGSTVEEAIKLISEKVKLPPGYHVGWSGEYESEKRAEARLLVVVPLTILVIYIILYTMFKSAKWALLILTNVAMAPHRRTGGLAGDGYALQRVLGCWLSGAVWRFGPNRRHHARIHQSAARSRLHHRRCRD